MRTPPFVLSSLLLTAACGASDDAPAAMIDSGVEVDTGDSGVDPVTIPPEIDQAFATDGFAWVEQEQGPSTYLDQLELAADGAIYATGFSFGPDAWLLACRFTADGVRDPAWAGDGCLSGSAGTFASTALLTTAGLVLGGAGPTLPSVFRYDGAGVLDAGFAAGGVLTVGTTTESSVTALAVDGDELMVASVAADQQLRLTRLSAAGAVLAEGVSALAGTSLFAPRSLVELADGRWLVAIRAFEGDATMIIEVSSDLTTFTRRAGTAGAIQLLLESDGALLVLDVTGLRRELPDGTLDPSFGVGGQVAIPTCGQGPCDRWNVMQRFPDGRIAVGGSHRAVSPAVASLRIYSATGVLDDGFGDDGVLRFPLRIDAARPSPGPMTLRDLVITADGGVVVVGHEDDIRPAWGFVSRVLPR